MSKVKSFDISKSASYLATRIKAGQVSWAEFAARLKEGVDVDADIKGLAIALGQTIKDHKFEYQRPNLRDLAKACHVSGLDKKGAKEFIGKTLAAAGMEDYSAPLYSRHLNKHYPKQGGGPKVLTEEEKAAEKKRKEEEKRAKLCDVTIANLEHLDAEEIQRVLAACESKLEIKVAEVA